ncbi:MAG: alpha/beta fold hydrolase [Gemmatimonadota bacterium]|nr:alpha/beta fold hydrolase [Gemmatimonadota bacterium]
MRPSRSSLALCVMVIAACEAEPQPSSGPRQLAGTLGVEGADLFYQAVGEGEPLVVVHGGPGLDHSYLRPWLDSLAAGRRVIYYDQRGLGRSAARVDSAGISMSRWLTDIDRVRERVARRERVAILAHSWGAIPALLYAIEAPERVDRLVLVSPVEPGADYQEETNARQAARRDSADARAIDSIGRSEAFAAGDRDAFNRLFTHVFRGTFADPARADSLLDLNLEDRTARQGRRVSMLLMGPLRGLDFWDELTSIQVPVLIVHGAADPIPVPMVRRLEESLPRGRLVVLEDVGHFPFIESPARFRSAVEGFLAEGSPAAP